MTKPEPDSKRRLTRSEVDDFAPGPRLPDSDRGGFETEHSANEPGGTTGEHSGQKTTGKSEKPKGQ